MANTTNIPEGTEVAMYCQNTNHHAVKMQVKTNTKTGYQFLGCPLYPTCKFTMDIPESIRMDFEGHPKLPGLDE
jgi:ssDNA-binding Zn-finger/Zn-ribbon topoisomerase 1